MFIEGGERSAGMTAPSAEDPEWIVVTDRRGGGRSKLAVFLWSHANDAAPYQIDACI